MPLDYKGRKLTGYSAERMRAAAEASLLDDSRNSVLLANIVLDLLDSNNRNETDYLLKDMYDNLGVIEREDG